MHSTDYTVAKCLSVCEANSIRTFIYPMFTATYATLSSVVNFLSTYSDKKSSTTLQKNVARFVSDSWASCLLHDVN